MQIKLNGIVTSHEPTSNEIVDIEGLSEEELDELHKFYERIGKRPREVPLPTTESEDGNYSGKHYE
ncbi:low affinity iron permease family protein [Chryseobacterium sp.]|uniref:low affinity iron permease family protein n=1 Tax=Chryseobacterium sp. TaxID=1871047 RepID=UPI0030149642